MLVPNLGSKIKSEIDAMKNGDDTDCNHIKMLVTNRMRVSVKLDKQVKHTYKYWCRYIASFYTDPKTNHSFYMAEAERLITLKPLWHTLIQLDAIYGR